MKTIRLSDGKYEFDLDDDGLMVAARRCGEDWPAGFEMRFTGAFMAALYEINELRLRASESTMELYRAEELARAARGMFGPTRDKTGNEHDELDAALSAYYRTRKSKPE